MAGSSAATRQNRDLMAACEHGIAGPGCGIPGSLGRLSASCAVRLGNPPRRSLKGEFLADGNRCDIRSKPYSASIRGPSGGLKICDVMKGIMRYDLRSHTGEWHG